MIKFTLHEYLSLNEICKAVERFYELYGLTDFIVDLSYNTRIKPSDIVKFKQIENLQEIKIEFVHEVCPSIAIIANKIISEV